MPSLVPQVFAITTITTGGGPVSDTNKKTIFSPPFRGVRTVAVFVGLYAGVVLCGSELGIGFLVALDENVVFVLCLYLLWTFWLFWTPENRTDDAATENKLRLADALFEGRESIVVCDTNQKIITINKAFTEMTGYTPDDVIGMDIRILQSENKSAAFYDSMWAEVNTSGTWAGDILTKNRNEDVYPVHLTVTAVKDEENQITNYILVFFNVSSYKVKEEESRLLSLYDSLTNLPNRRLFMDRLNHIINVYQREGKQFAILSLDLDHFKDINDNYGHNEGDELLLQVGGRISEILRNTDIVARLGGDEFVVLLEDVSNPEAAGRVAQEIITAVSVPFCLTKNNNVQINTSVGISVYPQHGACSETLMDHSDKALYQAKDAGRGCFSYFSADLTIATKQRIALEVQLSHAIERKELRIYYQPQVDIVSDKIIGAEALVRWKESEGKLLQPAQFIPFIENTDLMVKIDKWVLEKSCAQWMKLQSMGLQTLTLAVNASPKQFHSAGFSDFLEKTLISTNFPPNQLEIEVTENACLNHKGTAAVTLGKLKELGVSVAIDDFGTGYSSLSYLVKYPTNKLKIDKSFIDNIPFRRDCMDVIRAIIVMGHLLGYKILAEGVETIDQLEFLKEFGCDIYQGYWKSEPVPAGRFLTLLRGGGR